MQRFLDNCLGSTKKTVLIADDYSSVRLTLGALLEQFGFDHVLTATNGKEALDMYHRYKQDIALVISDIQMPEMRGDELFWKLSESCETVRMILCSGYCNNVDVGPLIQAGLKGCIQKPFHPEVLEFAIVRAFFDLVK
jgi:CheY-like chemotaxis protein